MGLLFCLPVTMTADALNRLTVAGQFLLLVTNQYMFMWR